MAEEPPTPWPWYRDPRTWRIGRVWQYWLMGVVTYLILFATLGREAILAAIHAVWSAQ